MREYSFTDDLICKFSDDVENMIATIQERDPRCVNETRHPCEIREDLTRVLHGCYPMFTGDEESDGAQKCSDEEECEYGCTNCPMKGARLVSDDVEYGHNLKDMVRHLIKMIKVDKDCEATELEVKAVLQILEEEGPV